MTISPLSIERDLGRKKVPASREITAFNMYGSTE
jgi:hypothetical protein